MIGLPRVKAGIDCVWGKREGRAGGTEPEDTHTVHLGWAGVTTTASPMGRTREGLI